jgi:hypothetical protein
MSATSPGAAKIMRWRFRISDTLPADGGIVEVEVIFLDTWVLKSGTYVS